ncbi:MAG: pilus assembly protein PilP [Mariprofundus sp.]|nr:pilus assembly protein PilP [Mariprofundus sp.]
MRLLITLLLSIALTPISYAAAGKTDAATPDAMQHLVTAPKIDFAKLRDPFVSYLASAASRGESALKANQLRLSSRQREPLEDFDLDGLKLVAIFSMGGERVAMVEDGTNKGYVIHQGNYLGRHGGKIDRITTSTVFLTEQTLNPAGDVINRQVTLTLNEVNQ